MNDCLKMFNIILLFLLLILYICSIEFESFYLILNNNKNFIFYFSINDLVFTIIIIIITLLLGFSSIYYSSKGKIFVYLIILFLFILEKFFFMVILYKRENIKFEFSFINIIFFLISGQTIILLLNLFLCILQRNKIIKEMKEAPLNYVDQNLTEEMYNSILTQSLNPEDQKLKLEFIEKLQQRKSSSRYSSSSLKS